MTGTEQLALAERVKGLLKLRFGDQAGTCTRWHLKNDTFYVRVYDGAQPECLTRDQTYELIEALEKLWEPRYYS